MALQTINGWSDTASNIYFKIIPSLETKISTLERDYQREQMHTNEFLMWQSLFAAVKLTPLQMLRQATGSQLWMFFAKFRL